jgi:hypothetical protein
MNSVGDQPHGLGLPHSEIRESTSARLSSRLFAACHVLHRLSVPRHPPNALITLDPELPNILRHTQGQTPSCDGKPSRRHNSCKKPMVPGEPVARSDKTHDPLTGPRFTHIHNIKQPSIFSIELTPSGYPKVERMPCP